ncbi:hypothetical protein COOONC_20556 [Cooperia oncophora]
MVTVALGLGTVLLRVREHYCWALVLALLCFYAVAIASAYKASEDHFTVEVLKNGWWAVLAAMSITTLSGFILKNAMHKYPPIAAFQPLING